MISVRYAADDDDSTTTTQHSTDAAVRIATATQLLCVYRTMLHRSTSNATLLPGFSRLHSSILQTIAQYAACSDTPVFAGQDPRVVHVIVR